MPFFQHAGYSIRKLNYFLFFGIIGLVPARAQVLGIKEAIQEGIVNYQTVKAKTAYVHAYESRLTERKLESLPDLSLSAQQDYGTVNGQYGVSYGFHGLGVSSSGPALGSQNWNSAFGSLYLSNLNWDFFSFGKARQRINVASGELRQSRADLNQEIFQQKIRISSAYLNLLAAQQLSKVQQSNLSRALSVAAVIRSRTKAGLNPGVDSSLANAQVSAARILLTNSRELVAEQSSQLSRLLGRIQPVFMLDTSILYKHAVIPDTGVHLVSEVHPLLEFYRSRASLSRQQEKFIRSQVWPTFSLFSVFQEKGSGFQNTYGQSNLNAFSHSYADGVNPRTGNYLVGIGLSWNLSNVLRFGHLAREQHLNSEGLDQEYALQASQLANDYLLSIRRLQHALSNLREAPVEIQAASQAFLQKKTLYANGLATVIDLTSAIYALNQAETDQAIAANNIWQALLYRAASTGNFDEFYNSL